METIPKKRPTSVTVIGWIFTVVAILSILSGGMGLAVFTLMQRTEGGIPPMPGDTPGPFKVKEVIFQNFGLLALLQIAFAIFVLIASIQFLKLRMWARTALEAISWLSLIYVVGFGIFWVASWISITASIPATEGVSGPPPMFRIFGAIMGMIVTAVSAVLPIVIIKFLRGKTIKEAVIQAWR